MKKNPFLRWKRLVKCRSFFHVMSLTLILTLSSLSGYGAKAVRDTISLNLQEVKLERFVEVMKQKTGLNFLYNSLLFKDAKPISVTANGENWESVLRRVLEKEGFTYDVKDEIVVIKRKVENDHNKFVIVKGKVIDSKKEPLPGVTVLLKGMTIGTVTDSKGNFSIKIPKCFCWEHFRLLNPVRLVFITVTHVIGFGQSLRIYVPAIFPLQKMRKYNSC